MGVRGWQRWLGAGAIALQAVLPALPAAAAVLAPRAESGCQVRGTKGDDVIRVNRPGAPRVRSVCGRGGDDRIVSYGARAVTLDGGAGDDTLEVRGDWSVGARSVLIGGSGDDLLVGGAGNQTLMGGHGQDTVSYAGYPATRPVTLALGSPATAAGWLGHETDLVAADVEHATGGAGDDRLTGSPGHNVLVGGAGSDRLRATPPGVDAAVDPGDPPSTDPGDTLAGGSGDDELTGSTGNDLLGGAGGADTLEAGAGTDACDRRASDVWSDCELTFTPDPTRFVVLVGQLHLADGSVPSTPMLVNVQRGTGYDAGAVVDELDGSFAMVAPAGSDVELLVHTPDETPFPTGLGTVSIQARIRDFALTGPQTLDMRLPPMHDLTITTVDLEDQPVPAYVTTSFGSGLRFPYDDLWPGAPTAEFASGFAASTGAGGAVTVRLFEMVRPALAGHDKIKARSTRDQTTVSVTTTLSTFTADAARTLVFALP